MTSATAPVLAGAAVIMFGFFSLTVEGGLGISVIATSAAPA
ncbi:MAG: hypothetical protein ACM3W4_07255 [Ignavibacteriales bacterium]